MTVYVFAKAYVAFDEMLDIVATETYKTIEEARADLYRERDMYLNDPDDDWTLDYGGEDDAVSCHLSQPSNNEEIILSISEHKI